MTDSEKLKIAVEALILIHTNSSSSPTCTCEDRADKALFQIITPNKSDTAPRVAREWFVELNKKGDLIGFARADLGFSKSDLFSINSPVPSEIIHVREILGEDE